MCKIFNHKIIEVKLFRPFEFKEDGMLGYVNYSYNRKSLYQRVGNFFSGIAPIIGGTIIIIVISILLFPSIYDNLNLSINISESKDILKILVDNLEAFYNAIFNLDNIKDIKFWIFIYLVTSISIHMTLSKADLENAKEGV